MESWSHEEEESCMTPLRRTQVMAAQLLDTGNGRRFVLDTPADKRKLKAVQASHGLQLQSLWRVPIAAVG